MLFPAAVTVYDPDLPGTRVLYYADKGFVTEPGDTPANQHFAPRLSRAASLARSIFAPGATRGRNQGVYGDAKLLNPDGELDALFDYSFPGQRFVQYALETPRAPTSADVLVTTTMDPGEFGRADVTIRLKDRMAIADVPIQTSLFLGTNALPDGLEGVEDIKGKCKPLLYGKVRNAPLICVNTSKGIFLAAENGLTTLDKVRVRGVEITVGGTYASLADLLDDGLAPSAGECKVYLAGGYVRFETFPDGQATFDGSRDTTAGGTTVGGIIDDILRQIFLVEGTDFESGIAATLDADYPNDAGIYVGTEVTKASALLDRCVNSFRGYWYARTDGVLDVGVLPVPSDETAVASFTENDMVAPGLNRVPVRDKDAGVPVWRVRIRYDRNYTVQSTDLAGAVTDADRVLLGQEWREVSAASATLLRELSGVDSDISASPWTSGSTPIVTNVTGPDGKLSGYSIEDDSAVASEYRRVGLDQLEDGGVIPVGIWVKKGTAADSFVRIEDDTALSMVLGARITWSGASPGTPTMSAGSFVSSEEGPDDWWYLRFDTATINAAHAHSLRLYGAMATVVDGSPTGTTLYAYPAFGPVIAEPGAPELVIDTVWVDEADAEAAGQAEYDLRSVKRDRFQFPVPMTTDTMARDLGDVIEIVHPRFGLSSGKNFVIIGIEPQPKGKIPMINLDVWG